MSPFKKIFLTVVGIGCLLAGIAMVLIWWVDVVHFFKGMAGMVVAVAGMILLYLLKEN